MAWDELFAVFVQHLSEFVYPFFYMVFDVVFVVQSNPILLLTFGLFILGGAIAIFGRILSRD